jgi:hypothetical protein
VVLSRQKCGIFFNKNCWPCFSRIVDFVSTKILGLFQRKYWICFYRNY